MRLYLQLEQGEAGISFAGLGVYEVAAPYVGCSQHAED